MSTLPVKAHLESRCRRKSPKDGDFPPASNGSSTVLGSLWFRGLLQQPRPPPSAVLNSPSATQRMAFLPTSQRKDSLPHRNSSSSFRISAAHLPASEPFSSQQKECLCCLRPSHLPQLEPLLYAILSFFSLTFSSPSLLGPSLRPVAPNLPEP